MSAQVGAKCNGGNHIQVEPGWWINTGCNQTSGVWFVAER